MRRPILFVVLAFIVGILGFGFMPLSASADTGCDAPILDETTDKVLSDRSKLQPAMDKLMEAGADVRIRAFQTAPYGSLETYRHQQIDSCDSWGKGDMKPNLIVIVFSMDRQSSILYGDGYASTVGKHAEDLRLEMGRYFRQGDFDGGVTATLDSTTGLITPFNWTGFWKWAGIIVGGIVLLALIVLIVFRIRRNSRKKNTMKQAIDEQKRELSDTLAGLSTYSDLTTTISLLEAMLNDEDKRKLQDLQVAFVTPYTEVVDEESRLGSLRLPKASQDDKVEARLAEYRAVVKKATSLRGALSDLTMFVNQKQTEIDNAASQLNKQTDTLRDLRSKLESLQTEEVLIPQDVSDRLEFVDTLLATARQEIDNKRAGQALDELNTSYGELSQVQASLKELVEQRDDVMRRTGSCSEELSVFNKGQGEFAARLQALSSQYGSAAISDLLTPRQAQKAHDEATAELGRAKTLADAQQWTKAAARLSACEQKLAESRTAHEGALARESELQTLQTTLPTLIDDARQEISDIADKVNRREGKQGGHLSELDQCLSDLGGIDMSDLLKARNALDKVRGRVATTDSASRRKHDQIVAEREAEEARRRRKQREEEEAARRKRREEEEEERRRRNTSYGYGAGSSYGSGSSYGGGSSFGGSSSGSWGGGSDGGSSSGSW